MRVVRQAVVLSLVAGVLAVVLPASPAHAVDRNFAVRFTTNTTGDIDIVGNTLLTCPDAAANCVASRNPPVNTVSNDALNNNYAMRYVDVDGDASTFNSSTSALSLPAGSTVLFAGLYWAGSSTAATRNTARLKVPGATTYQTVTSTTLDDGGSVGYQAFADVTTQVVAAGSGGYTLANVQANASSGLMSGWSLVVAYRDTTQPARNLTVFDGLKTVNGTTGNTIAVSGFQTPPSGPVNTTVGFVAYEGDAGIVGDSARLNGVALTDAQHPATNFFDSRSSRNGVLRTGNNPGYANNFGYESSMLAVGNTYVPNGSTSATIALGTTGDVYLAGVVTFATELYAPRIEQTKTVLDVDGGSVEQGDLLRYTISGTNTGSDAAVGAVLRDPVPADTTYVPGSIRVTQPGGTSTPRTDAAGDDVAEHDAATDRVVARIGTGANATLGGTIPVNGSYAVSFDVVVDGPDPAVPHGTLITNTATLSYSGAVLGTPLTAASSVARTVAAPDLAITKTHTGDLVRGTPATFTLGVANTGPVATQGTVTVTDTLPAGLTPVSAAGPGWACTIAGQTVTCTRAGALAGGASYPPVSLVVDVTDDAPAMVSNTAIVSGGGDSPEGNNTAVDGAATVSRTDLEVSVTPLAATSPVGTPVTLTLTLTNDGPSRSTGGTVVHTLPPGLMFVSADPACVYAPAASTITCTAGPLANGASRSFDVVVVPRTGTAGDTLSSTTTGFANEDDPDGVTPVVSTIAVPAVDLTITSRVAGNPPALNQGGTYTWLLDVTNDGGSRAADAVVRFTVPTGLTVLPGALDPRCLVEAATGDVVCVLGTLAPGAVVPTISIGATVATGPTAPTTISTLASVTSSEDDADPVDNQAATSHAVVGGVDLSVTVAANPTSVGAGDTVTLIATVANAGPGTPEDPTLVLAIPVDTTFVSAPAGCTYAAATRTVTCLLDPAALQAGESVDVPIVVEVVDRPTGTALSGSAEVSTTSPETDPSDDRTDYSAPLLPYAGLSITKTADRTQAAPGQTITYTLTAANEGPATAHDVVVSDLLPAGTTYAAATPASCTASGATVTCPVGSVAPGAQRVVTITATVDPVAASTDTHRHQLDATKVEANLSVPAGASQGATASCPAGSLATDGSVRIDAVDQGGALTDAHVLTSRATADGRGWTGTVRNSAPGQAQAKVEVVCTSDRTTVVDGHAHDLLVTTPVTTAVDWSAGTWTADLDCGPGRVATAPGFAFTTGEGVVRTSKRNGPGWRFVVDVPEAARGTFEVRCLSSSLGVAEGHTHDLDLDQRAASVTVPPGQVVQLQLTCADDAKGIVASYDVAPGLVALGNDPQPKTRVFRFYNPTGAPLEAQVGLLCLGTRTGPATAVTTLVNTAYVATSVPDRATADDTATASVTATASAGPVFRPAPVASVRRGARTAVGVGVVTDRTARFTVQLRAPRAMAGGVRRGDVLAQRTATVTRGSHQVVIPVRRAAAAIRQGKLLRAVVVVTSVATGERVVRTVRLR